MTLGVDPFAVRVLQVLAWLGYTANCPQERIEEIQNQLQQEYDVKCHQFQIDSTAQYKEQITQLKSTLQEKEQTIQNFS